MNTPTDVKDKIGIAIGALGWILLILAITMTTTVYEWLNFIAAHILLIGGAVAFMSLFWAVLWLFKR